MATLKERITQLVFWWRVQRKLPHGLMLLAVRVFAMVFSVVFCLVSLLLAAAASKWAWNYLF